MSVSWNDDAMISAFGQALLIVLYSSVMVFALVGNSVVCWTVISSRRMHCVINYFLVNLAVSDIMMAVLCIPFTFVANVLLHNWPFGAVLCPLVSYSQVVSVLLSAFTLLAISLDRYRAILFPMRPRLSTRAAAVVIGTIWALAMVVSLPVAVMSRLGFGRNQTNAVRCNEAWPNETHRYVYSIVVMILQYFLPLSVLVFTYTRIAIVIWAARTPGEALDHRDQRMAASKRKMVKMMLTVVVIYAICWLPLHAITLVGDAIPKVVWRLEHIQSVWVVCHWVAMSSCAYNPIVYCWMNSRFRRGFAAAFRCTCFRLSARGPEARKSCTWRTIRSTISAHRLVPIHRGTAGRGSVALGNFKRSERERVLGCGAASQRTLTNGQLQLEMIVPVFPVVSPRTTLARDQMDDGSGIDHSQSSPSVDLEPGALESLAEASRSVAIAQLTIIGQTSADQQIGQ